MTTDINELVKRLREPYYARSSNFDVTTNEAADALEAMAAERDRLNFAMRRLTTRTKITTEERIVIAEEALGGDA